MKLKNKLLSAGLAACMIVPMAMPVCANEVNPATNESQNTILTYTVVSDYTWTIHSEINFVKGKDDHVKEVDGVAKTGDKKVQVTKNVIEEGKKLRITARGSGDNGAFSVKNGDKGTQVLGYTVQAGTKNVGIDGTVLDVDAGTNTGSADMTFTLSTTDKGAEIAGTYTGQITYQAKLVGKDEA